MPTPRNNWQTPISAYHATIDAMLRGETAGWTEAPIGFHSLGVDENSDWLNAINQLLTAIPAESISRICDIVIPDLLKQGRDGEALAALRKMATISPDDAHVQELLGIILADCGDRGEAETHLRRALSIEPQRTTADLRLISLLIRDRGEEAKQRLESIREEDGQILARLSLQLQLAITDGDTCGADAIGRQLTETALNSNQALGQVIEILTQCGRTDQAIERRRDAPDDVDSLHLDLTLARCLVNQEPGTELHSDLWNQWAATHGEIPDMMVLLASRERRCSRTERVESLLRNAIEKQPEDANICFQLGDLLLELGRIDEAIVITRTAWEQNPRDARINLNLGLLHVLNNAALDGLAYLQRGLMLQPRAGHGFMALGAVLRLLGDIHGAEQACRELLKCFPDEPAFQTNLGMVLLHQGDYQQGWPAYEARLAPGLFPVPSPRGVKRWDQQSATEELILVAEQGAGDLIQFMRYAGFLKLLIPRVSIQADARFRTLLELFGTFDAIHTPESCPEDTAGCEWMPLMSVPGLLGVTADNPLIEAPYLAAFSESVQRWTAVLRRGMSEPERLVALHWQGNPEPERSWSMAGRSFRLEDLSAVAAGHGIRLVSVQKGTGSEQLAECSFLHRFVGAQPLVDQCWDYAETAAILASCDLVISSDSGIAHLAGALGLTTWLLLDYAPDWRWGGRGDRTIWYPSMRLFRQEQLGDWSPVGRAVSLALSELGARDTSQSNPAQNPRETR
jgi:Flp pilus assembly protein TadD